MATNYYNGWADYAAGYNLGLNQIGISPGPSLVGHEGIAPPSGSTLGPVPLSPDQKKYIEAATAAPTAPPSPFDSQYFSNIAGVDRTYNDTMSGLAYDESQLGPTYGYSNDAAGNIVADPSNPFSRAALLQRSYQQSQARDTNSYASRGQLYAGSLQNERNFTTLKNQQSVDALKRQFQAALHAILEKRTQAGTTRANQTTGFQNDAINRAVAAGQKG